MFQQHLIIAHEIVRLGGQHGSNVTEWGVRGNFDDRQLSHVRKPVNGASETALHVIARRFRDAVRHSGLAPAAQHARHLASLFERRAMRYPIPLACGNGGLRTLPSFSEN